MFNLIECKNPKIFQPSASVEIFDFHSMLKINDCLFYKAKIKSCALLHKCKTLEKIKSNNDDLEKNF